MRFDNAVKVGRALRPNLARSDLFARDADLKSVFCGVFPVCFLSIESSRQSLSVSKRLDLELNLEIGWHESDGTEAGTGAERSAAEDGLIGDKWSTGLAMFDSETRNGGARGETAREGLREGGTERLSHIPRLRDSVARLPCRAGPREPALSNSESLIHGEPRTLGERLLDFGTREAASCVLGVVRRICVMVFDDEVLFILTGSDVNLVLVECTAREGLNPRTGVEQREEVFNSVSDV